MNWRKWAIAGVMSGLASVALGDWNSFRGPNHDGITDEKVVWAKGKQPKQLWKVKVGEGFGSMAVSNGKVYVTAAGDAQEALLCLDANTGDRKWHQVMGKTIMEKQGGNGPRSTPTVDGKLVFAYGTYFNLICCDAESGKLIWSHDLNSEFAGQSGTSGIKEWGNAASPVVDGDLVYVCGGGAGQSFIAFDKSTGRVAWKNGSDKTTQSTPTVATILGVRQVIFFTQSGLASLEALTGKELWRYPFPFKVSTASTPVVAGEIVYCTAGYGVGAGAAKIAKSGDSWSATEIWRNKDANELVNHWTSCVYKDGYLYGIFGFKQHGTAPLKCVEVATGNVKWTHPGYGPGGTILAGDDLVVQGDAGQIAIVKATPEGYTELAAGKFFDGGKCWNEAIVSNGRLYARSAKKKDDDQPYIICLDVSGK